MSTGFEVHVSQHMVGAKSAIRVGRNKLVVSPAMYDLMSHATPDELQALCERITVMEIPDFDLPRTMPVRPPEFNERTVLAIHAARYW
jgi:hypothetical protein